MTVRRFQVDGIVQGVGFRPFVYRTASALGLDGWVANVNGHVEGEVAGPPDVIEEFAARLRADAPVLARVRGVRPDAHYTGVGAPRGLPRVAQRARPYGHGAARDPSGRGDLRRLPGELFDPRDRRYRYPFINCTDCGPRPPSSRTFRTTGSVRRCGASRSAPTARRNTPTRRPALPRRAGGLPRLRPAPGLDEGGPTRGEEALRAAVEPSPGVASSR